MQKLETMPKVSTPRPRKKTHTKPTPAPARLDAPMSKTTAPRRSTRGATPGQPPQKASAAKPPTSTPRKRPVTAKRARPAAASETPLLQKVAFTLFQVGDPARARAFYEETLGLTRGMASDNGAWTEYDLPSGGCLALFCHPNPEFRAAPGGASIAFEVSDLDALNARLHNAGVQFLGDVVHGPNCRMFNIKDSEGNAIILHQRNPSVRR